jgi:hypothetical protein
MSASDHLSPDQFHDLYHGTTHSNASGIKSGGLHAQYYDPHYPVLAQHKSDAKEFGMNIHSIQPKELSVVHFRVPHSEAGSYIDRNSTAEVYSLKQPLPNRMVHRVEDYYGHERK